MEEMNLTMETERLIIRRFTPEDWQDLYEYLSLPEVVLYEPYNVYTKEECIKESKNRAEEENNRFWAVELKENKKMIGHIYFAQNQPIHFHTWSIGYVFNPKFHGKGFATEAAQEVLKYGFEEKGAHRIIAGCNVKNEASWRLLERLSMRREGHMLKNVTFKRTEEGEPIWNDSYHYGILSTEYKGHDCK